MNADNENLLKQVLGNIPEERRAEAAKLVERLNQLSVTAEPPQAHPWLTKNGIFVPISEDPPITFSYAFVYYGAINEKEAMKQIKLYEHILETELSQDQKIMLFNLMMCFEHQYPHEEFFVWNYTIETLPEARYKQFLMENQKLPKDIKRYACNSYWGNDSNLTFGDDEDFLMECIQEHMGANYDEGWSMQFFDLLPAEGKGGKISVKITGIEIESESEIEI